MLRGKPIIIGIHGLDNKPEPAVLRQWWEAAIKEGIARHCGGQKVKVRFQLVYWADLLYPTPLPVGEAADPYVPAEGEGPLPRAGLSVRRVTAARLREQVGRLFEKASGAPVAGNIIKDAMKTKMPDLHHYKYDRTLRRAVQDRLVKRLRSARRRRRRLMLIGHSMGSIVAYEVLRDAGRVLPGLEVAHFVTVGSPLGLAEFKEVVDGPLSVPECVAAWSNFADPRDKVARWDTSLSTDYQPNSRGVTISDHLVVNGYLSPAGKANPHKIYGYLRTPEVSEMVVAFLR